VTVRYRLECELSYEVKAPTVFIFNLEVARLLRHHYLVERLTVRQTFRVAFIQSPIFRTAT